MGFTVYSTAGTGEALARHGMKPTILQKINAGARPNVIDLMADKHINLVLNTPTRTGWNTDEGKIRAAAVRMGVPMLTTVAAAHAAVAAIQARRAGDWSVHALQDAFGDSAPIVQTPAAPTRPRAEPVSTARPG